MWSRSRIRAALIALIVLAIVGWFAQQAFGVGISAPQSGSLPDAEPASEVVLLSSPPSGAALGAGSGAV